MTNAHVQSGDSAGTLLGHPKGLFVLFFVFPVVIGEGKRLFGEGAIPGSYKLTDTQLSTTGAVLHVYERDGGLRYGEVEVGQETVVFDGAEHGR